VAGALLQVIWVSGVVLLLAALEWGVTAGVLWAIATGAVILATWILAAFPAKRGAYDRIWEAEDEKVLDAALEKVHAQGDGASILKDYGIVPSNVVIDEEGDDGGRD